MMGVLEKTTNNVVAKVITKTFSSKQPVTLKLLQQPFQDCLTIVDKTGSKEFTKKNSPLSKLFKPSKQFALIKSSTIFTDAKQQIDLLAKQVAKKLHTTPSTIPEVIAMEKKMAKLGVKVCFADNTEAAKIITGAIEQLKAKGCKLPKQIFLMTPNDSRIGGFCPLKFVDSENSFIFLNKNIECFTKKVDKTKSELSDIIKGKNKDTDLTGFFSTLGIKSNATDTAEGAIFHEIGHFIHQDTALSLKEAQKIWQSVCDKGLDIDIAQEVGMYASTGNKLRAGEEFVAEVFAGLMSGKKYSDKVMELYNALKGPKVL